MNSTKNQDVLVKNLVAFARRLKFGHKWIFQHDNDPKQTSKSTKKLLLDHKMNILPKPSQAPDLNPVQKLQFELKRTVHKRRPRDIKGSGKILHGGMV
jgi:hypothetical protein